MDRVAFSLFGKDIYWYGIIIACGLLIGVILGVREAKRRGYRSEMILDFLLIAIPICIVCARLFYVAFEWPLYASDPIKIIAIWEGGLAIYGAVFGGVISAIIFFSWRRVPVGEIMDITAPSLVIAQAIGRWGNFVNQEAYGYAIRDAKWQWFPAGVFIQADATWHMATFFYESVWNLLVFLILLIYKRKAKHRGNVFAMYLLGYGIGRFVIEPLRTDSLWLFGGQTAQQIADMKISWGLWFFQDGMRISQLISILLIVGSIIYLVLQRKRDREELAYDGFYSASWTKEKIDDYRVNSKVYRAKEKARISALKVENLKKEQVAIAEKAEADAKHAAKRVEALRGKSEAEANKAQKAEDKSEKTKQKAVVIEENTRIAAMEAAEKAKDKLRRAEEKQKKAEQKLEQLMSEKEKEDAADDKEEDSDK